jgi:hypothetical protein
MDQTLLHIPGATRQALATTSQEQLIDRLEEAECRFLRFLGPADYTLPEVSRMQACPAGGYLLEGQGTSFWIPRLPIARRLDKQGHILEETTVPILKLQLDAAGLSLTFAPPVGFVIDLVVWKLSFALKQELLDLAPIETQSYFLWGSHTCYAKPADLYLHLIHGWVYEDRAVWPKYWKICSENDAHALYVLFSGLERATGKTLYRLFKQQLVLAVLARQAEDGGFYHGEWTEGMESHLRLVTSGLHLLLDAFEASQAPELANAIVKTTQFLLQRADRLDCGLWFRHDSLELAESTMRQSPFPWRSCRAFGKSVSNMLVLNSHLDTTIAIARGASLLKVPEWQQAVAEANLATETLLAAAPADWLYRLIFGLIALSFLPTAQAAHLPLWQRALKRLGWKYLIPHFYQIKCRFPRLSMPGGYLDRALCLKGISPAYHAINFMDLVRLKARFPELNLQAYLDAAFAFTYRSGLWERWGEDERTRYAYGFWAEALHRLCLLEEALELRARLAETMYRLDTLGLGQAPGLLGGDYERGGVDPMALKLHQLPASVRIAKLSTASRRQYLLLGTGQKPIELDLLALGPELTLSDAQGQTLGKRVLLQPGQWVLAR